MRREEITKGRSTKVELIKEKLGRLRERERKLDVLRKTVKRIVDLARDLKAKVIIGKFSSKAKDRMESDKDSRLRHRIHQWSVVRFVEMVNYPALTDGASPPRDLPLLGATSIPPQRRFHPTVPRTPRGVTEGLHRPEPQSRGPALTARGLHIYFLITVKTSLRGLSIPTEGDFRPLNPQKVKSKDKLRHG